MKVLLTGAGGQLGQALIASAPRESNCSPPAVSGSLADLMLPRRRTTAQTRLGAQRRCLHSGGRGESEPELAHAVNMEHRSLRQRS